MPTSLPAHPELCPRCSTLTVLFDADPGGLAMCLCPRCSGMAARKGDATSALRRRLLSWLEGRISGLRSSLPFGDLRRPTDRRSPVLVPIRVRSSKPRVDRSIR
jgi:hypothetical protein